MGTRLADNNNNSKAEKLLSLRSESFHIHILMPNLMAYGMPCLEVPAYLDSIRLKYSTKRTLFMYRSDQMFCLVLNGEPNSTLYWNF